MTNEEEMDFHDPTLDAITLNSTGNFGSSVWDPVIGGAGIEITICDGCLYERQLHAIQYETTHVPVKYEVIKRLLAKPRP
jgi:hypothetical protein